MLCITVLIIGNHYYKVGVLLQYSRMTREVSGGEERTVASTSGDSEVS